MPKKRLLFVDDQRYMHQLIGVGVEQAGLEFVAAQTLHRALELVGSDVFDIVLTDLSLGAEDGLTLLDALRIDPNTKGIPVVVLTMHDDPEHFEEARRRGADDYIVKPFQMKRIKDAISRWSNLSNYDIAWDRLSGEQARLTRLTVSTMGSVFKAAKSGDEVPLGLIKSNCLSILQAGTDDDIVNSLSILKDHDIKTYLHCVRFSAYLGMMAAAQGAGGGDMLDVITAGLMHDIGVTRIPAAVLEQEHWSSDERRWFRKAHVEAAAEVMDAQAEPFSAVVREVMTLHHERLDGSGPLGIPGVELSEIARMAAVVETFLTLRDGVHGGGYRNSQPFDEMRDDAGLDPEMVALLAKVLAA